MAEYEKHCLPSQLKKKKAFSKTTNAAWKDIRPVCFIWAVFKTVKRKCQNKLRLLHFLMAAQLRRVCQITVADLKNEHTVRSGLEEGRGSSPSLQVFLFFKF